jgi:hypothetical protein
MTHCKGSTSGEFRTGKRHLDDLLADWLENQEASGLCKTCIANALGNAVTGIALAIIKNAPDKQVKLNVMLHLQETMRAIAASNPAGHAELTKGSSNE